jgi:hypothetical protein
MNGASTARRNVTGGWLLAAAQCALALWFACCVYLALTHAAKFSGFLYVPSIDDPYTAEIDVLGDWAWRIPVGMTLGLGPLVAGLSVVATAVLLITRYARGSRALTAVLVFGAVVAALTVAAGVSPDVQSIRGWIGD